jgi:hypothetical protein
LKPRIFTVAEANRQIPRVQKVISRLEEWQPRLLEGRERLKEMAALQADEKGPVDHRERIRLSHEVEMAEHEILGALQEIEKIGCVLKEGGLVDFFTVKDGILYELCWRSGEEEIRFYHEFGTGFNGRQPLTLEDIRGMGVGFSAVI